jgi:hypothetical protein
MAALRSDTHKTITHHSYRPKNSKGTIYYITDKIIARFKPNTTSTQMEELLKQYGLNIIKQYKTHQDKKNISIKSNINKQ